MTREEHFRLKFDGPAVEGGEIDVRDLAPALLELGHLFEAARRALDPAAPPVSVHVRATREGSFEIDLVTIQSIFDGLMAWVSSDEAVVVNRLLDLLLKGVEVGGVTWSLVALIRKLRGLSPERTERHGDIVRLYVNHEILVVPNDVYKLYSNVEVRKAVDLVVRPPLEREGIDELSFSDTGGRPFARVKKGEAQWFRAPQLDNIINQQLIRKSFRIMSLTFQGAKWRLNDGHSTSWVTIADEDFLARVDRHEESFVKDDILVCEVLMIERQTDKGLKMEYIVEKVLRHIHPPRQLDLPGSAPPHEG